MLGLCCNGTFSAMMIYDDRYDDGDNDGNKYRNNDNDSVTVSGSDGPIFYQVMMPWSCGEVSDNSSMSLRPQHTMYLRV